MGSGLKPRQLEFDLQFLDPFQHEEPFDAHWKKSSISMVDFHDFDVDESESPMFPGKQSLKRSESMQVGYIKEWHIFDDDPHDLF
jgi:hypothetical protein